MSQLCDFNKTEESQCQKCQAFKSFDTENKFLNPIQMCSQNKHNSIYGQMNRSSKISDNHRQGDKQMNRLKREFISLRTKLVKSFNWGKINAS